MRTLLHKIFFAHWQRKAIAFILGSIVWLTVNHSLTSTKVITNVPIRIINLSSEKTVEGMQNNGRLSKKVTLTLAGNTNVLKNLNANDIEIVLDAAGQPDIWNISISKKNLVSLNPELDITNGVSKVYTPSFFLHMTKLITEKIPVIVTRPIGEAPRGYQFLDIWPYQVSVTVSGPEDIIKRLKHKEQKITFNLSDISKSQLDALAETQASDKTDVVSFFVPDQWKQIYIPILSDTPFDLEDSPDSPLRIDFLTRYLIPINSRITVSMFYPPESASIYNPHTLKIHPSSLICEENGIFMINAPLYAKGSDRLFAQIIKNRIQILIIAAPSAKKPSLEWGVEFVNPTLLENEYVARLMTDASDEDIKIMKPSVRENYLRNRFRSYMNRFRLFTANNKKFFMTAQIVDHAVIIEETTP